MTDYETIALIEWHAGQIAHWGKNSAWLSREKWQHHSARIVELLATIPADTEAMRP